MWQSRDETIRLCDEAADRIEALSHRAGPMEAVAALSSRPVDDTGGEFSSVNPEALGGWQTTDTAPRDGTEVILATVIDGFVYEEPATGRWTGRTWEPSWQGRSVIEYQDDFGTDWQSFAPQPTHWMPLPPAPDTVSTNEVRG
jgi:hypothetical protein